MLHLLFSLLCVKYIFFWFYRSVRFEAKERVTTCKDYIIGREITTVLKIPVDSVTLKLCDSRNYFTKKKERKPYDIVCIVHAQTYPRKSSRLRPLRHRRFHNNYGLWCNRLQGVNKSYVVVVSCCATD